MTIGQFCDTERGEPKRLTVAEIFLSRMMSSPKIDMTSSDEPQHETRVKSGDGKR